jgi:hypothetical protein
MRPLSARLVSMDSAFNEHFAWQGVQSYKVVRYSENKNKKSQNH